MHVGTLAVSWRTDALPHTQLFSPSLHECVGQREAEVAGKIREMSETLPTFLQSQLIMTNGGWVVLQRHLPLLWLLLLLGMDTHFISWAFLWLGLQCTFCKPGPNQLNLKQPYEVVMCNSCRAWVAVQKKGSVDKRKCLFYLICSPVIWPKPTIQAVPGWKLTYNQWQWFNTNQQFYRFKEIKKNKVICVCVVS